MRGVIFTIETAKDAEDLSQVIEVFGILCGELAHIIATPQLNPDQTFILEPIQRLS